jgi:hypothetical protein
MGNENKSTISIIDRDKLPSMFPTHKHTGEFWEYLGRTIATFGFLEEILRKAIFAFSATKKCKIEEFDAAYQAWLPKLEIALTDPLCNLADVYGKTVLENPDSKYGNINGLVEAIKAEASIRNVLCHGSWRSPDSSGASVPFFVNKRHEVFETAIDVNFLIQTQAYVVELACSVIESVTLMGWQFPGGIGPGKTIWPTE